MANCLEGCIIKSLKLKLNGGIVNLNGGAEASSQHGRLRECQKLVDKVNILAGKLLLIYCKDFYISAGKIVVFYSRLRDIGPRERHRTP